MTPPANPLKAGAISLLYPPGAERPSISGRPVPDEADLGLATIVRALDLDGRQGRFIANVLAELHTDPQVITYRQDVLDDLMRLPTLAAAIGAALPQLAELSGISRSSLWGERIPLLQVAGRLAELDSYVSCVELLGAALDAADERRMTNDEVSATFDIHPPSSVLRPSSAGLLALRARLDEVRAEPDYRSLVAELPALRAQLERASSVTLGINLDAQLRPESATLVSINQGRFAGKGTLLERLFGERTAADAVRGVTALYNADDGRPNTPEHALFREMGRLLERVVQPVAEAIERYTRLSSGWLIGLAPELAFYLGAAQLFGELRAVGLPLCRPTIVAAEERAGTLDSVYNLDLALRLRAARSNPNAGQSNAGLAAAIITNDVSFGPHARIAIVTGPNSGGKTTYIRAVGQAQVLFQAGLLIPARAAQLSPVDGIFTHFAASERAELGRGRLAQELERLGEVFRRASSHSLLLLNEPLTSTDQASARALGRDLLAGLRLLGARAIFVTHLHELVDDALALDSATGEPAMISMVAAVAQQTGNGVEPIPTYKVVPGRPQAPGYAAELARQYGLDATQIARTLRERGVI
jgi:hypothetical protein